MKSHIWIVEAKVGNEWVPSSRFGWYRTKKEARTHSTRSVLLRAKRYEAVR
jgi:hypothetical protein